MTDTRKTSGERVNTRITIEIFHPATDNRAVDDLSDEIESTIQGCRAGGVWGEDTSIVWAVQTYY